MTIKFLGHGLDQESINSVGNHLMALIKNEEFHSFTALSAFISIAGINGIANTINEERNRYKKLFFITGVDQKGTSKEALEALLDLKIESYVFYQPSASIFHPKIYLFEGDKITEVIIGSSNLTAHGLFVNVEASLSISLDNKNEVDQVILTEIKDYLASLLDLSDPNLKPLSVDLINSLVQHNIVPPESERRKMYVKEEIASPEDSIDSIFPKRILSKISKEFKSPLATSQIATTPPVVTALTPTIIPTTATTHINVTAAPSPIRNRQLVWIRRTLPASSVQNSGAGTNSTGGLRLVQDRFTVGGIRIDQTTYFRSLFDNYVWRQVRTTPFVEKATIPFELTIKGVFKGVFNLDVRHKPSGDAGQNNYTTSISWGTAVSHIQKENLTGYRLELYAPSNTGGAFSITII